VLVYNSVLLTIIFVMKTNTQIVFDFDGPLANSKPLLLEFTAICLQTDYDNSLQDQIDYFMSPKHCENTILTQEEYLEKKQWIDSFTQFVIEKTGEPKVPLFEAFIQEIKKLDQKEFGVISSGTSSYIFPSLAEHAETFPHVLCFDTHRSKVYKMKQLEQIMGYNRNTNIVYITDTLSDVIELEDYLGLDNIYGVSWGVHSADILSTKLPDKNILHNFTDLHKIF
jgi:phosphoglycolate phosphatase-like HAD superfamily hydrolase